MLVEELVETLGFVGKSPALILAAFYSASPANGFPAKDILPAYRCGVRILQDLIAGRRNHRGLRRWACFRL